jgi:hypothetical protein
MKLDTLSADEIFSQACFAVWDLPKDDPLRDELRKIQGAIPTVVAEYPPSRKAYLEQIRGPLRDLLTKILSANKKIK